jgi:hypothetical protein
VEGGTVEVLRVGAIHDYTARVDDEVEAKSKTKSKSKAWKMLGSGKWMSVCHPAWLRTFLP